MFCVKSGFCQIWAMMMSVFCIVYIFNLRKLPKRYSQQYYGMVKKRRPVIKIDHYLTSHFWRNHQPVDGAISGKWITFYYPQQVKVLFLTSHCLWDNIYNKQTYKLFHVKQKCKFITTFSSPVKRANFEPRLFNLLRLITQ